MGLGGFLEVKLAGLLKALRSSHGINKIGGRGVVPKSQAPLHLMLFFEIEVGNASLEVILGPPGW